MSLARVWTVSGLDPPPGADGAPRWVVVGEVSGVFGVRGWVRVFSHTDPRENILHLSPWYLGGPGGWAACRLVEGRSHAKGIVVRIEGCDDRDQAATLVGKQIAVDRAQLPPPAEDEIYWADLEGLRVSNLEGIELGVVDHLFSTGANDVLVVRGSRERLIPFVWDEVVREVALDRRELRVDWDPDF